MRRCDHGGEMMPQGDSIIHYILYGGILIAAFIILKSPKKK